MTGRIHSFESFGTVDGPGIRFVVFLQGCPLRCLYCHNPDTWAAGGQEYTSDDVVSRVLRYRNYYGDQGGATVTGGEPLLQIDFVIELFTKLKEQGIRTCVDTSGITFNPDSEQSVEKHKKLLAVTDLVMLDIKHIDEEEHKKLTMHSNKNILDFAKYLSEKGVPTWIRHVVVPNITYKEEYLIRLGEFLAGLKNVKALDVLPYHDMAVPKYENLGLKYPLEGVSPLTHEEALNARNIIIQAMK